jgi:hypothetical protein
MYIYFIYTCIYIIYIYIFWTENQRTNTKPTFKRYPYAHFTTVQNIQQKRISVFSVVLTKHTVRYHFIRIILRRTMCCYKHGQPHKGLIFLPTHSVPVSQASRRWEGSTADRVDIQHFGEPSLSLIMYGFKVSCLWLCRGWEVLVSNPVLHSTTAKFQHNTSNWAMTASFRILFNYGSRSFRFSRDSSGCI